MSDEKRLSEEEMPSENDGLKSRREFLSAVKGWSTAVIAGAAVGSLVASEAEARGAWANRGGGGGGAWGNRGGGGGGAWANNRGGGGVWGNGGGTWGNRGGGVWANGGGVWANGGRVWANWR